MSDLGIGLLAGMVIGAGTMAFVILGGVWAASLHAQRRRALWRAAR